MPTTRRRVNLTLTELEERFLDAITTAGTPEHHAYVRYLAGGEAAAGDLAAAPMPTLADAVHVLVRVGMDRLEHELADISYAAEAAAYTPADRARTDAMRARLIAAAARSDG